MTAALATQYLGMELRNPLIASASPLTAELAQLRALEDHGAAAVVLPSIFQEQLEHDDAVTERLVSAGADSVAEASGYFAPAAHARGRDRYLRFIADARSALEIPVIASLNGATLSGWTEYARDMEQAGASAIELNVFTVPVDFQHDGAAVEGDYVSILRAVRQAVRIPVSMKLSPFFTAPGHLIRALEREGADGFVLFNRFYQPDIDVARLLVQRDLTLSSAAEMRLPLLWIGILAGNVRASLAASTGVECADDVLKYLLAGADAVMTTSAILRHGAAHMGVLVAGISAWMQARQTTVSDMRGRLSRRRVADRAAYERANYIRILQGFR